jgi:hypothetical protein
MFLLKLIFDCKGEPVIIIADFIVKLFRLISGG